MSDDEDFDETDHAFHRWMAPVIQEIRLQVVRSLLAGNDAQAFTTKQYQEAYRRTVWGKGIESMLDHDLARAHLRSLPDAVRELIPDIWVPKEDE